MEPPLFVAAVRARPGRAIGHAARGLVVWPQIRSANRSMRLSDMFWDEARVHIPSMRVEGIVHQRCLKILLVQARGCAHASGHFAYGIAWVPAVGVVARGHHGVKVETRCQQGPRPHDEIVRLLIWLSPHLSRSTMLFISGAITKRPDEALCQRNRSGDAGVWRLDGAAAAGCVILKNR